MFKVTANDLFVCCVHVLVWPFLIQRLIKVINYLKLQLSNCVHIILVGHTHSVYQYRYKLNEFRCNAVESWNAMKKVISDLLYRPLKTWFYIVPEICPHDVCKRGEVTSPWWLSRGRDMWKLDPAGDRSQMMAVMWQDRTGTALLSTCRL